MKTPAKPSGFPAYCDIEQDYPILHRAIAEGVNGGTLTPPDGWTRKDAKALRKQCGEYYIRAGQIISDVAGANRAATTEANLDVLGACSEISSVALHWIRRGLVK